MEQLEALKDLLSVPQRAVIIPHRKPDADALGSCLGLWHYLKKLGHEATVVSPTDYPEFLWWMEGNSEVLNFENQHHNAKALRAIANATLICCLDFSDLKRIEDMEAAVLANKHAKIFMIDHHRGKVDFAHFELWNIEASATAELVYEFIEMMGHAHLIDLAIAACLYAGIMTDTGSFKYSSTSPKTHRIAAMLKESGLDTTEIHRKIHDNNSVARLQLLGFALCNRMHILKDRSTAYIALSEKDLQQFNHQTGDTEGIVNYALSIKGIVLAALLVQDKEKIKMSFRSTGDFPANELASKYFEGGGHRNAAGGRFMGTLEAAVGKLTEVLPEYQSAFEREKR